MHRLTHVTIHFQFRHWNAMIFNFGKSPQMDLDWKTGFHWLKRIKSSQDVPGRPTRSTYKLRYNWG